MQINEYIRQRLSEGVSPRTIQKDVAAQFGMTIWQAALHIIRVQGAPSWISPSVSASGRKRVYQRDGRICQYCGTTDAKTYIIEHVIPFLRGGLSLTFNLVVACASCNHIKGNKVWIPRNIEELRKENYKWAARIERLCDEYMLFLSEDTARLLAFLTKQQRQFAPDTTEEAIVEQLIRMARQEETDEYQRRADTGSRS